jgi:serine/threonine protein kinase
MEELRDRVFDRKYRLVRLLGEGGMGAIYEAEHTLINRRVALKVLHPDLVAQPEALERFVREAQAASSIGHPNIVEIHDVGREPDGAAFMVMELLKGRDLGSALQLEGVIDPGRAVDIALQILSALHEVHRQGIVHRDMKPENIFLTIDDRMREVVKILDFGIARVEQRADTPESFSRTRTGVVLGTPYYLAPEQARGLRRFDHRVDLWSVGVMLYEMLSGARPFEGENYNEILSAILMDAPRPLAGIAPRLPARLTAIVERALQKNPDERYSTAGELLADLLPLHDSSRGFNSSVEIHLRRHDDASGNLAEVASRRRRSLPTSPSGWLLNSDIPFTTAPLEAAGRTGRRRLLFGAAGALAAGLVVAAGLALFGRGSAPETDGAAPSPPSSALAADPALLAPTAPVFGLIRIEIDGLPDGARIALDGRELASPFETERTGEPAILSVAADGYFPLTRAVVLDRDLRLSLAMDRLEPESEAGPARPAAKAPRKKHAGGGGRGVWADNPFGG